MILVAAVIIVALLYIFNRLTCGRTESVRCLIGKTAIVTGGNSGIGFQVCLNLASRGCRVIIADKDDSEISKNRIIKITRNPNVISKKLNLASFSSIRKFANDIVNTEERLDILINNAGISLSSPEPTEDGLHSVMQVNYFGPFLLTHLLTNLLKKSAPSRIVFTSSIFAFSGNLNFDNPFQLTSIFYAHSKLATLMASDMFAEKLKDAGVTSNSLHPGFVWTSLFKAIGEIQTGGKLILVLYKLCYFLFGKTVWEGAQTTTHLAAAEELDNVTGEYFLDCRKFIKPRQANDKKLCQKVWDYSENFVKLLPQEKI